MEDLVRIAHLAQRAVQHFQIAHARVVAADLQAGHQQAGHQVARPGIGRPLVREFAQALVQRLVAGGARRFFREREDAAGGEIFFGVGILWRH